MKNRYQAVIIGAGRIAVGFDTPRSKEVLTHAHAYQLNTKIQLAGIYDIDWSKSRQAAQKWSTRAFSDLDQMFVEVNPDVVSICTPDQTHYEVLKKILKYHPKLVICEKPLTTSLADTKKIIALYKRAQVPLLVNYTRRFDSTVEKIKHCIDLGMYGKIVGATALYSKGTLHSGSHMIDLARYLFGEVQPGSKVFYSQSDYTPSDKTVSAFLQFKKCPQFVLLAGDERLYSIFELDILFAKKRIRFTDAGFYMAEHIAGHDPFYSGYTVLSKSTVTKTNLPSALKKLIDNAVEHLDHGAPLICDGIEAYKTQVICLDLLQKIKKQ